jgi:hypothetical protein
MTTAVSTNTFGFDYTVQKRTTPRALWYLVSVMALTTVHHSYGAIIYETPWRHHVAVVAIVTVLVLIATLRMHRSLAGKLFGKIAFWMFTMTAMLIPVIGIGLFEGGYNHIMKDLLYFSEASGTLMARLFPPPTYEMPGDAFFEITGILQFFLGVAGGWEVFKLLRQHREAK